MWTHTNKHTEYDNMSMYYSRHCLAPSKLLVGLQVVIVIGCLAINTLLLLSEWWLKERQIKDVSDHCAIKINFKALTKAEIA